MLKFLIKIAMQQVLASLPGTSVYEQLINLTGSHAVHHSRMQQKLDVALSYLDALDELGERTVFQDGVLVDLGVGWHLAMPLLYWQLGAECQHVTDIRREAREDVLASVVRMMPEASVPRQRRPLPDIAARSVDEYLQALNIHYHAPSTGPVPAPSGSASLFTATQMLYHLPPLEVRAVFEDAARLLKPGGFFIATLHLHDLYSNFDRRLPPHNFLRYSSRTWERWFNSSHMYYNRLRASDYEQMFEGLPFKKALWKIDPPTEADIVALNRMPPHPEYAHYDRPDLAARHLFFVMRRQRRDV